MTENKPDTTQQVDATRRQGSEAYFQPAADITETDENIILAFDMPGVPKEGIDVTLEKGVLSIVGQAEPEESGQAVYRETRVGNYKREFTFRDDVDPNKVSAEMKDGVLRITVGKPEAIKPRQIPIKSA